MDFKLALARAWAIVTLNKDAVREVAGDENAMIPALVITVIGGLAGTLITLNPVFWAGGIVFSLVGLVIGAGVLHLLAGLFGGRGSYTAFLKVLGHGSGLVSWAAVIPVIGGLVGLWSIPIAVISVEELYGLTRGKAIAVVLIPIAVLLALSCVAAVMFGAAAAAFLAHLQG